MLEYLKIIERKLNDTFSTPNIAKKINNVNCKDHVDKKLKEQINKDLH